MTTKKEFITDITNKLGRPLPEKIEPPDFSDHPADGLYDDFSKQDFIDQFIRELEALSGKVIRVPSMNALPDAIHSFLKEGDVSDVVVWSDEDERSVTIRKACDAYAGQKKDARVLVWEDKENRGELIAAVEQADAGVVYAEYGISETGTVVLYNKAGKGRSASVLPNNIGIVLNTKKIVPRITQVFEQLHEPAIDHSCINFISGPSRSADIEMSLSIGVHGPGEITVFLVD